MGESDRYNDYQIPKRKKFTLGEDGNALVGLFTLNVIFFLSLFTIEVVYYFFQANKGLFNAEVVQYFALPAQLSKLVIRPWTLITYMFTHIGIWDIISNMLWLWGFGYILQDLTGNKKLIPIYIYGGLLGAVFFIAANYAIPSLKLFVDQSQLIGGSAATMAVAIATTTLAPNYRFYKNINRGIPLWTLTVIYILISFSKIADASYAYILAYIGGGLAGFIFSYLLRKDIDAGIWMNDIYSWFITLFNPAKKAKVVSIKEKIFYNASNRTPYKKTSNVTQQRVDEILDKIHQSGYNSISEEEREILKRASEEDNFS
ncbi:MAG: rhomboid family intramembrane serine protease [Sphingobacteriales bacterium]|nr:rhomboid family intramembrane serine protease [Sphingobacteriales bacterium]